MPVPAHDDGKGTITPAREIIQRWHVTPASVHRYCFAAVEASVFLGAEKLQIGHEMLHAKVRELVLLGFNYESAMFKILDSHSFGSILALASGPEALALKSLKGETSREGRESPRKRGGKGREGRDDRDRGGRESPRRSGKETAKSFCHDWNNPGKGCDRGKKCLHLHECEHCGSVDHSGWQCTAAGAKRDAKKRRN